MTRKLNQNRQELRERLKRLRGCIENRHGKLTRKIRVLQIVTLLLTIILGCGILFFGKQILGQIRRTVVETQRIEDDLSYKIEIDNSIPDEFKVGFKALNSMSKSAADHIQQLDAAYNELAQSNQNLKIEVEDRKLAEETLRQYAHIISSTADLMSFVDQNYIYRAANQAYLDKHMKTRSEIIGHGVSELVGTDIFEVIVKDHLDRSLAGDEIHYQEWFEYPKTGFRYMDVAYYPYVNVDGVISGVVVGVRDITELKHTEDQLNVSLKEKEVLLCEIHHRVKNNMQVIVSLLRLHSRRVNDARLEEIFNECRDRIYAMSLIHEALYQSDNLARIDFKVYLTKLCRNLNQVYGAYGYSLA